MGNAIDQLVALFQGHAAAWAPTLPGYATALFAGRAVIECGWVVGVFGVRVREPGVIKRWLPEVRNGEQRIMLVGGEVAGAVNRVPAADDLRSNRVRGGAAKATDLTPREREICARLAPALRERGLLFVGIDVIDGHLTEINVTSPTGIRALARPGGPDGGTDIWDGIRHKRA